MVSSAAAAELASLKRLGLQRALLGVAAGVGAAVATSFDPRLALALTAGSIAAGALTQLSARGRNRLQLVLVASGEADGLAEVRRFGVSLITRSKRLALARSIAAVLREAGGSESIFLLERISAVAPELTVIARSLADEETVVEPAAAATLTHLLTDGRRSPLLNPSTGPEELRRALARVLAGMHPRGETTVARRATRM